MRKGRCGSSEGKKEKGTRDKSAVSSRVGTAASVRE